MVMNLKKVFDRAVNTYLESEGSSDEDDKSSVSGNGILSSPTYSTKTSPVSKTSQKHKHSSRKPNKSSGNRTSGSSTRADKKRGKEIYDYAESEDLDSGPEMDLSNHKDIKMSKKKSKTSRHESRIKQEVEDRSSRDKSKKRKFSEPEVTPPKKEKHKNKKLKEKHLSVNKETKENRKRKENFEEEADLSDVPKSKIRKIENKKLESKDLDILKDVSKKNKLKSESLVENKKKLSSPKKKKEDKEKSKKEAKKKSSNESFDSHKVKIEPLDIKKDTELLDGLKDTINERRKEKEEKLKLGKKKKNKSSKVATDVHDKSSKHVPSKTNNFKNCSVEKVSSGGGGSDERSVKLSKKSSKENNRNVSSGDVSTHNGDRSSEPKKIKPASKKSVTKVAAVTVEKDEASAIQAERLNQATEQTLNVSIS